MSALDKQEGGGHYKELKIQPVEYIVANKLSFLEGNVVKYITRHKQKNGVEDIKKVIHYCELILQLEYGQSKLKFDDATLNKILDVIDSVRGTVHYSNSPHGNNEEIVNPFLDAVADEIHFLKGKE